jgi:hypothetical protein
MERLTFAGIERKTHPRYLYYVDNILENREIVDENDNEIIEDILEEYKKYSAIMDLASGEWSWIQENKQKDYKKALADQDKDTLIVMYRNFFRNQISFGISAPDTDTDADRFELANATLLDIDTWQEFCSELPVSALEAPKIGNPFGIIVDNALVMYNSCRHYYHATKIKALTEHRVKPVIFEIGAGYGGVFFFLNQMRESFCYIVCDLMETLLTNYYFTKKWSCQADKRIAIKWALDGRISQEDIEQYQLVLVPSVSHENINTYFDVAYNSNSFSEMSYEDISKYFDTIARNKTEYIFHQNSNFRLWETSSRGHTEVLAQDFPIPPSYKLIYQAISPWTGAGGRYREYLLQFS